MTKFVPSAIFEIKGPNMLTLTFDIVHVTTRFAVCYFILVVHWNRDSVSTCNALQDICIEIYLDNDLDL